MCQGPKVVSPAVQGPIGVSTDLTIHPLLRGQASWLRETMFETGQKLPITLLEAYSFMFDPEVVNLSMPTWRCAFIVIWVVVWSACIPLLLPGCLIASIEVAQLCSPVDSLNLKGLCIVYIHATCFVFISRLVYMYMLAYIG